MNLHDQNRPPEPPRFVRGDTTTHPLGYNGQLISTYLEDHSEDDLECTNCGEYAFTQTTYERWYRIKRVSFRNAVMQDDLNRVDIDSGAADYDDHLDATGWDCANCGVSVRGPLADLLNDTEE